MTCEEFLNLLDEDGLEGSPEAAAHAEACASCRAALERWRVVRHEFTAMRDEPAPPFLHTRVMAHVQGAPPEGHDWFGWLRAFRPTWATTALVLILGIAIGGLSVWRWRSGPAGPAAPIPGRELALKKADAPEARREAAPSPSGAPATGEAAGPPIFQGAADEPGPEGAAPAAPEPAVRDAARAPQADESSLVVCTLKSLDQGGLLVLQIPLEAAPPPSGGWSVLVGGDGSMTVLDVSGARLARPHPALLSILATQRLTPGRYLLKRVG
jgi:hypothetical protein